LHISLKILKLPLPIIWLDTSILFDIIRWKQKKPLSDPQKEKRIPILYNSIYDLVRKERLICAEADQTEENERYGLGLFRTVLSEVSLGVRFLHSNEIKETQTHFHMKACIAQETEIEINSRHAFLNDPQKTIAETKEEGIIIRVDITSQTDIDNIIKARKEYCAQFEEIRLLNLRRGINFKNQIEIEYLAFYEYILNEINFYASCLRNPFFLNTNDVLRMTGLRRLLTGWDKLSGKECDITGLLDFSKSDYYRCIPVTDISCKLNALLLTDRKQVGTGDFMDIKQLSAVIPYCSLVITDRAMCHNLRSLGINTQYETTVFALKDFDEIMECLDSL
jgi:hypothetical protein